MGRQVRRVPLDFAWPMNETWPGFLPPQCRACPSACVHGSTIDGKWLEVISHLLMMCGEARRGRPMHPWLAALPLAPYRPTTDRFTELTSRLAGRPPSIFGHDGIDRWRATAAILKAAGLPEDWGTCQTCSGSGIHPDDQAMVDAWESEPPPSGPGFQMWETTSEGSPISPVFATPELLASWLATNGASAFGSEGATYEQWLGMIRAEWAPSAMMRDGGPLVSGVQAISEMPPRE